METNHSAIWILINTHTLPDAAGCVAAGCVAAVDDVNLSFGVRKITLDANTGMQLNGEHVKMRGYCDHSSFGGVGSAVPDRVQLFHAQMLRFSGGNSWRMAHNPPVPARLDVADRIGVLILDENHFYGEHGRPCTCSHVSAYPQLPSDLAQFI